MKMIKLWMLYLLLIGFGSVAVVPVAFAQALPELTEEYTFGDLVVRYPEAWAIQEGDTLTLATSIRTLTDALNGTSPFGDNIVFTFLAPSSLGNIGIGTRTQPDVAIVAMMDAADFQGLPEDYPEIGIPAASAYVFGDVMEYGQLVAVQFNTGIVMVAIEFTSDPRNYAELVTHIISAMRYNGQFAGEVGGVTGADDLSTSTTNETELRQWASSATASSEYGSESWSAMQATGEPNTEDCGDYRTAWASATSQGVDTLTVSFDQAVMPTQVNIYQTFNPGSIIGVELSNSVTGETFGIPNSVDSPGNTACPGIFTLDIDNASGRMDTVKIYLDQSIGGSWNEIDAVELVGLSDNGSSNSTDSTNMDNLRQWANYANGTSQFGEEGWSFMQATGAPDSEGCGDSLQAWASSSSTSSEILALEFEQAVIPAQVNIHQVYNPGSITRIELTNTDTSAVIAVPDSADPPGNTPCPGIFTVNIEDVNTPVNGVIIYFDQSIGGSWNEIDAVELVGVLEAGEPTSKVATPGGLTNAGTEPVELTEVFTFEGENHLTLSYPDGWVTDVSQLPAIASSEEALAALQQSAPLPEGEIAIGIIPPGDMPGALGVTPSNAASETLSDLAALFGVTDVEMGPYQGLDYPAFSAPLTGTQMLPPNTHILTVEHTNGVVTFLIVAETLSTWDSLLKEMIDSLNLS